VVAILGSGFLQSAPLQNEQLKYKERILLPKEKYFDTSIQEIETMEF